MAIDVGDPVSLTVEIRDAAGALADAGAVALTIELPDGTSASPAVSHPSTGRYQVDYPAVQAGRHLVRWVATGINASAYSEAFDVRPASPAYLISPDDARKALTSTDAAAAAMAAHDDELRLFVEAATGVVERHLGEVVLRRSITEFHRLSHRSVSSVMCRSVPVISLTSLATVDGTRTWDVAGLHPNPTTGEVSALSGAWFTGHLRLVYVAGRQVIPADYVLATRITLQHLWTTQRGSRGAPRAGGMGPAPVLGMGFALPHAAIELLGSGMPGIA